MSVMVNRAAGERARFLSPVGDPVLEMLLELDPTHHGPPPHVHVAAEETFAVVDGALEILLDRSWRRLDAGQEAVVPRGSRHTYRGLPGSSARTVVRISPGGPMRAFLTDMYGLAAQGRVDAEGAPRLRDAARLFRQHPQAMSVSGVPVLLQRPLWWALSTGTTPTAPASRLDRSTT